MADDRVSACTESVVEQAAPAWLESSGWSVSNDAFHKLARPKGAELIQRNRAFMPQAQEDRK